MSMYKLNLSPDIKEIHVSDIPGVIAGVLEPFSKIDFSGTRQAAILLEHGKAVEEASLAGELIGRNPLTKIKEPFSMGDQLQRSVLNVEEFSIYLGKYEIEVVVTDKTKRLTIEEAAKKLARNSFEEEKSLLGLMLKSIKAGDLRVYKPGSLVPHYLDIIREFYDEVFLDEVDAWLDKHLSKIVWRFSSNRGEGLQSIESILGEEPDYREWRGFGEYVLLADAICYALGVHPNPEKRSAFVDSKVESFSLLNKRAKSEIYSGNLLAKEDGEDLWITKFAFYNWIQRQGESLNSEFLDLEPSLDIKTKPKNKADQRVDEIARLANQEFEDPLNIPYGGKATLKKNLTQTTPSLFTEATFDSAWKIALTRNLVKTADHERYASSKL